MKKEIKYTVESLYKVRVQVYVLDTPIHHACIEFRSDLEYDPMFWVHYNHSIVGRFSSYMDAISALRSHALAFEEKLKNDESK